ncbi:hypothetical protein Tco_1135187 [Tanacetum coccineum]
MNNVLSLKKNILIAVLLDNTIITSLKALDKVFSSKNYVRKFFRALHPKWRAKVTTIEESKDLSSLALDELISNLKVHEVVMEKNSKIYKGKKERVKFVALKAKKESSDDETSTPKSDEEEYAMAVRNFKKFFRRKGRFVRQPREEKKSFRLHKTRIKKHLLEVLGEIAKMKPRTKPTKKLVSWLNLQMRPPEVARNDPAIWVPKLGENTELSMLKELVVTPYEPNVVADAYEFNKRGTQQVVHGDHGRVRSDSTFLLPDTNIEHTNLNDIQVQGYVRPAHKRGYKEESGELEIKRNTCIVMHFSDGKKEKQAAGFLLMPRAVAAKEYPRLRGAIKALHATGLVYRMLELEPTGN